MRRPARRIGVFLCALAVRRALGDPPGRLSPFWLGWALEWGGGVLVRPLLLLGVSAPLLSRLGRRPGVAAVAIESVLLASTFDLFRLDRLAARVQRSLQAGDVAAARAPLESLAGAPLPDLDAAAVASRTITELAQRPADAYLAPWFAYALFGLPGAMTYRLAAWLEHSPAPGWLRFLARAAAWRGEQLRTQAAYLQAVLVAIAAPLGGGRSRRVWPGLAASFTDWAFRRRPVPSGSAVMAAALNVALVGEDGAPLQAAAPPATQDDVARARRIHGGVALLGAALVALTIVGLAIARPRARRGR